MSPSTGNEKNYTNTVKVLKSQTDIFAHLALQKYNDCKYILINRMNRTPPNNNWHSFYLYSEIEHQTVWMSLCQFIEKVSPRGVCDHLLQPSRRLKAQSGFVSKRRGRPGIWTTAFPKSHLSFNSEDGISFLGVKVFYQETLEVIFHSLLDLSRLNTCSQGQQNDLWVPWSGVGQRSHRRVSSDASTSRTSCDLPFTHLNEPLCQQINGLSHSGVVVRKQLDDEFWRTTCFKIAARRPILYYEPFREKPWKTLWQ